MRPLFLLAVLFFPVQLHAEIHKWVDANGTVHFDQLKPAGSIKSEKVEVSVASGKSESADTQNTKRFDGAVPSGSRKLTPEVQEMINTARDNMLKTTPSTDALDCSRAVSNTISGIDTMLDVGRQNYRDGYMTKAEYDNNIPKLEQFRREVSVSDCQSASGKNLAFYKCMNNSYNYVVGCLNQMH